MRFVLLAAFASISFACAARPAVSPASAETTAASEEATPGASSATSSSSNEAAHTEDAPAANLVCRAVSDTGKKVELFLDWEGSEAHGVLRETAPSGMVYEKKVRAERQRGVIIADDIYEQDLVVHAALVAERAGKKQIKVEDKWTTCQ